MPTAALADAWSRLGGDPAALDRLTLTGPARTLRSTLPCTAAGVAAVASSLLAATTGPVGLDTRALAVAVRSERFLRRDGASPGAPFDPLSAFHRAADGWVRLHANYPWHRAAALRVLGCADDLGAVRRAVAAWPAVELETALHEAGGVAAACRTQAEWAAEVGRGSAGPEVGRGGQTAAPEVPGPGAAVAAGPGTAGTGTAGPGTARPGTARPGTAGPGAAGSAGPAAGRTEHPHARPEHADARPEHAHGRREGAHARPEHAHGVPEGAHGRPEHAHGHGPALPLVERHDLGPAAPRRATGRLRVLDLTRVIAGPVATRTLAVHGADVLRVDPPGRPEMPLQAWDMLPGKRSALADLADRDTREELLRGADVVVTGYRPGALDRFGLAPEALARRHPGLVVATLSAWGHEGPWAGRRGFDSLVQAACGIAVREAGPGWTGDGPPGVLPAQLLDHATGYLLAAAVSLAVAGQRARGGTPHVRLSLLGTAQWLLGLPAEDGPVADEVDPAPHLQEVDAPDGRLTLAGPPGTVGGRALRWGPPAPAFGTAAARW